MTDSPLSFEQLGLNSSILEAIKAIGYETPSPIQAQSIPIILEGRDVLGQAQTGTGKTAAFALPILQKINAKSKLPQVLVLAPTRELAIQVAEAFQSYAQHMKGFHVLPIYGGQGYDGQIRALKRGVQVVVGTPGRVMDHMRKGTLKLDALSHLVLDEADEMLRMGFIDDVEWILSQTPEQRQIALFSATMPREIERVANTYLRNPALVKIEQKTTTASTIRQRYWPVSGLHKLDATTRILESEKFDAMIMFVRTKTATVELAEKLQARGYSAAALNGDISQQIRERTIDKLKKSQIDILVATDVAARGLDVERISHVLNYDIPYDTEAYVHRIGRTGRAGRTGEAILFVANREQRMLRSIERATGQKIERMQMPSAADINEHRVARFKQRIDEARDNEQIEMFRAIVQDYQHDTEVDAIELAAALACLAQGDQPLFLKDDPKPRKEPRERNERSENPRERRERRPRGDDDVPMESFRIEVGHKDKVKPGDIVGAIANEADIESQYIGHIKINETFSTVDLPAGMPDEVFQILKNTWVRGRQLKITRDSGKFERKRGKFSDKNDRFSDKKERFSDKKDKFSEKKKPRKRNRPPTE